MTERFEPDDRLVIRHVGSGVFGVKERQGVLLQIVTVRDTFGTRTTLDVAVSPRLDSSQADKAMVMHFDTSNRQLADPSEWRIVGKLSV